MTTEQRVPADPEWYVVLGYCDGADWNRVPYGTINRFTTGLAHLIAPIHVEIVGGWNGVRARVRWECIICRASGFLETYERGVTAWPDSLDKGKPPDRPTVTLHGHVEIAEP